MTPVNNKTLSTLFLVFVFILFSLPAFADYKITLKNGREFVVEDYKDAGSKIKFFRAGGEIEIDKALIETIKEIKNAKTTTQEFILPEGPTDKDPVESKPVEKSSQDTDSRLKDIAKKKEALRLEAEKLINERKKLEEDMKKEGKATSIRKGREFENRIKELNEKVNKYNEEILKFDNEQQRLLQEQKK